MAFLSVSRAARGAGHAESENIGLFLLLPVPYRLWNRLAVNWVMYGAKLVEAR
jgi:hypothetical protein